MKKTVILAASVLLCGWLLCSCASGKLQGSYTFGKGVNSSQITLNEDGSFVFVFSQQSSYLGIGKFSVKGDQLTLETSDGKYHYVFRITDSGLVFDADASSDTLWLAEFTDGSVFG